jgi:hypothetical protein
MTSTVGHIISSIISVLVVTKGPIVGNTTYSSKVVFISDGAHENSDTHWWAIMNNRSTGGNTSEKYSHPISMIIIK